MTSKPSGTLLASLQAIDTERIQEIGRKHLWQPLLQHSLLETQKPLVITEGKGCYVIDSEGHEYLDAFSGLWAVNIGYGRQEVADAVYRQMNQLMYYPLSQLNVPAALLAEKLASILPGDLERIFFVNSGSEAVETALKIARQYGRQKYPGENRYKIISRYRSYHGFTMGALSATGQKMRKRKFEPLVPGFLHAHPPYCYRCPLNLKYPECNIQCAEEIGNIIQHEGKESVAAVIAEPIIGGGGVIVPPPEYFPKLRKICDDHGVLLIADEVITGFGRTGTLFASEAFNIQPDMITLAKGISSAYLPLAACATTPNVFEAFLGSPGAELEFGQVSTFGGHPVACAAGLANLDILLRERLWENSAEVGSYLLKRLEQLKEFPIVGDVRGKGLLAGIEIVMDENKTPADDKTIGAILKGAREEGVIVGRMAMAVTDYNNVVALSPPLSLKKEEADRIVDALTKSIGKVTKSL
jgi:taurine-pyruvate aminotransferase